MTLGKLALLLLLSALLGGCGTAAVLQKDSAGPGPDESVIVIGVKPDTFRLHLREGTYASGGVTLDRVWGSAAINGVAKDGYLVARAKAGQVLVVSDIYANYESGRGGSYGACAGNRALVFEVPKGQIAYVSDLEYEERDKKLWVRYVNRLAAAQEHVRANYPRLTQEVQALKAQTLPVHTKCPGGGVIFIPIYVR